MCPCLKNPCGFDGINANWHSCVIPAAQIPWVVLLSVMWFSRMMNNYRYTFKQNKIQSSLTFHSSYIPQISWISKQHKAHFVFIRERNLSCRLRFSPWLNVWHDIPKSNELLNNFLWCKVCSIPETYSLNANSTLHHCGNKIIKCQVQSWVLIVFSQQKHRKSGSDVSSVLGRSEDHFLAHQHLGQAMWRQNNKVPQIWMA